MNADSIRIECEEDGFRLRIHGSQLYIFKINDPEAFYDHVKAAIGPWLYERDQAREAYNARVCSDSLWAYDPADPKHPDFHSVHADIWDARTGK